MSQSCRWQNSTYSVSRSRRERCRSRLRTYVPIPKSRSFRASMAIRTGSDCTLGFLVDGLAAKPQIGPQQRYPGGMVLLVEGQVAPPVRGLCRGRCGRARPPAQMDDLGGGREQDRVPPGPDRGAEVDV